MVDATVEKPHGPSYKEACEAIAKHWNSIQSDRVYTANEIYNYSPTGELAHIYSWYPEARDAGFRANDDTVPDEKWVNPNSLIRKDLLQ